MAATYEGKIMKIEMTSGAEAIGRFHSADNVTMMVTFTQVRWTKAEGGVTHGFDPNRIEPSQAFHSSNLKGLTVVDNAPAIPAPAPEAQLAPQLQQSAWGVHQTVQTPSSQEPSPSPKAMPTPPQPAWGRTRPQPPARAAQPAPTAGTLGHGRGADRATGRSGQPATAQAPSSWAHAVGGSAGGRGASGSGAPSGRDGGSGGGGGGSGGRGRWNSGRGRAWTPGVPQGDSSAAAVSDDFDFTANNVAFEAEKPNLLAELGLDGVNNLEADLTPPSERKPEYDDGFFDNISHSLHEKTGLVVPQPRLNLKEQREMNLETFGAAQVPRSAHPRGMHGRNYGSNRGNGSGGYGNNGNGGGGGHAGAAAVGGRRGDGGRGGGGAPSRGRGRGRDSNGWRGRGGGGGGGRGEGRGREGGGRNSGRGGGGAWGRGRSGDGSGDGGGYNGGRSSSRGAMRGPSRAAAVA